MAMTWLMYFKVVDSTSKKEENGFANKEDLQTKNLLQIVKNNCKRIKSRQDNESANTANKSVLNERGSSWCFFLIYWNWSKSRWDGGARQKVDQRVNSYVNNLQRMLTKRQIHPIIWRHLPRSIITCTPLFLLFKPCSHLEPQGTSFPSAFTFHILFPHQRFQEGNWWQSIKYCTMLAAGANVFSPLNQLE